MGMLNNYEENEVVVDDEDDAMNNIDADELAESASAFGKVVSNLESQDASTSTAASASIFPSMATPAINGNDFPDDDDDFFEAIDENTIVKAKAVVNDLEEMDMDDIPQDEEEDDDIFMKQMEAQMKRAEMAETQNLEQEKQLDEDLENEKLKDKQKEPVSSIAVEPVVIEESEDVDPDPIPSPIASNPNGDQEGDKADADTILVNDMTTIVVSGVVSGDMEKTCAVEVDADVDEDDGIMLDELRDNEETDE